MKKILLFLSLCFMSLVCFAQEVPDVDIWTQLAALFQGGNEGGWMALASGVIILLVNILKKGILGFNFDSLGAVWKRVILVVLGQVYAVIQMVAAGSTWGQAAINGFLVSGGAIAIWEVIKPLFDKKEA